MNTKSPPVRWCVLLIWSALFFGLPSGDTAAQSATATNSLPDAVHSLALQSASQKSDGPWREALSLSLDRGTMAGVLLQKQAEPAAALLPEWLSGYAFLFTVETNLERARELRAALPKNGAGSLILRIDSPVELPTLLGERVAVNARQAGINVQVVPRTQRQTTSSSLPAAGTWSGLAIHLFVWRTQSLSPRMELPQISNALHLGVSDDAPFLDDLRTIYVTGKLLLEEHKIIPLVLIPDYAALSPNVRDWMPSSWGEWHLADVWLDQPESAAMGAKR